MLDDEDDDLLLLPIPNSNPLEVAVMRTEMMNAVNAFLESLDPTDRWIAHHRWVLGWTESEVADLLRLSRQTITKRSRNIRLKGQEILADFADYDY